MVFGQILLSLLIIFALYRLIGNFLNKKISKIDFIGWLCFWLIALTIVIYPDITNWLARFLGIGRGADVIIYFALIIIFYFLFSFSRKLRSMEKSITDVVREISIRDKSKIENQK
jgi:hypothetical protein